MNDLQDYTADQLLKYAYPEVRKGNNGDIPVYRYLSQAQEKYPEIELETKHNFDELATNTNKKNRYVTAGYASLSELWDDLKENPDKAYRVMCSMPEDKMDIDALERILKELFNQDKNALECLKGDTRVNVKRLIRMYDYLKWGKK